MDSQIDIPNSEKCYRYNVISPCMMPTFKRSVNGFADAVLSNPGTQRRVVLRRGPKQIEPLQVEIQPRSVVQQPIQRPSYENITLHVESNVGHNHNNQQPEIDFKSLPEDPYGQVGRVTNVDNFEGNIGNLPQNLRIPNSEIEDYEEQKFDEEIKDRNANKGKKFIWCYLFGIFLAGIILIVCKWMIEKNKENRKMQEIIEQMKEKLIQNNQDNTLYNNKISMLEATLNQLGQKFQLLNNAASKLHAQNNDLLLENQNLRKKQMMHNQNMSKGQSSGIQTIETKKYTIETKESNSDEDDEEEEEEDQ